MTRDEFRKIANMLNAAYSEKGYTFIASKEQAEGWYELLSDLDYTICSKAVVNIVTTTEKPPKVATIRNAYFELTTEGGMTEGEAWAMVREGIRNGIYGAVDEFGKFPPDIKRAVGAPMSLSEWAMMSSDDVETVIHSQFLRAYREVRAMEKQERVIGQIGAKRGSMAELAEMVAKQLEGKNEDSN